MNKIINLYRVANWLSLDIVLGAMACSLFFMRITGTPISWLRLVLLGLSVWVIYTGDHLLDAMRIKEPHANRHRFHRLYFITLLTALFITLSGIGILLFFIQPETIEGGIIIIHLVLLYLILRNYFGVIKEIGVSFLFCLGVILPLVVDMPSSWQLLTHWEVMAFFNVTLINVLVFSWHECPDDSRDGFPSFAVHFGRQSTRWTIFILIVIQLVILAYAVATASYTMAIIIFFLMTGILTLIIIYPHYFSAHERFRLWGDGVFLLPLILDCFPQL